MSRYQQAGGLQFGNFSVLFSMPLSSAYKYLGDTLGENILLHESKKTN